jgi:hypothetical protein
MTTPLFSLHRNFTTLRKLDSAGIRDTRRIKVLLSLILLLLSVLPFVACSTIDLVADIKKERTERTTAAIAEILRGYDVIRLPVYCRNYYLSRLIGYFAWTTQTIVSHEPYSTETVLQVALPRNSTREEQLNTMLLYACQRAFYYSEVACPPGRDCSFYWIGVHGYFIGTLPSISTWKSNAFELGSVAAGTVYVGNVEYTNPRYWHAHVCLADEQPYVLHAVTGEKL